MTELSSIGDDKTADSQAQGVARVSEIAPGTDRRDPKLREQALEILESGGIVLLPNAGFELTAQERILIADAAVTLPTRTPPSLTWAPSSSPAVFITLT